MVAAQDLGSCDFGRVGSSPISRTCDYSVFLDFTALLLHCGSIRIDVLVWCFVGFLWGLLMLPTTPRMFSRAPPAAVSSAGFLPIFFVACHCRDWNTVAIRDGMGYPHTSSSIAPTQRQNIVEFGVPSHVFFHCFPSGAYRRVKSLEDKQNRQNASFAYRRARENS